MLSSVQAHRAPSPLHVSCLRQSFTSSNPLYKHHHRKYFPTLPPTPPRTGPRPGWLRPSHGRLPPPGPLRSRGTRLQPAPNCNYILSERNVEYILTQIQKQFCKFIINILKTKHSQGSQQTLSDRQLGPPHKSETAPILRVYSKHRPWGSLRPSTVVSRIWRPAWRGLAR